MSRTACLESSYWLADTAAVRSCSKPHQLATGPGPFADPGQTPVGTDSSSGQLRNQYFAGVRGTGLLEDHRATPAAVSLAGAAALADHLDLVPRRHLYRWP